MTATVALDINPRHFQELVLTRLKHARAAAITADNLNLISDLDDQIRFVESQLCLAALLGSR